LIVGVALGASILAALLPARQAARIQPAVSLRVAD
jgi:ABC-type lipoprotein release transport system permease subunit